MRRAHKGANTVLDVTASSPSEDAWSEKEILLPGSTKIHRAKQKLQRGQESILRDLFYTQRSIIDQGVECC